MRHERFPCYTIKDKGTNGIAKKKDIWYDKLGTNGITNNVKRDTERAKRMVRDWSVMPSCI